MDSSVRIVLVDDHTLFRDGVREILSTVEGLEVVGEAADHDGAIALIAEHRPDVVLLDVQLGDSDAVETAREIRETSPQTRIVVLSMHDDPEVVRELIAVGVRGYLIKNATRHELVSAIRCSLEGTHVVLATSLQLLARRTDRAALEHVLSPRELEVTALVAQALSNAQIARRLNLSEATVKRHLRAVFAKLGAVSRVDAVNKAAAADLLSRPS